MTFYFVGLDMQSPAFDYGQALSALRVLKGQQVSRRVWLCGVHREHSARVFALVQRCLAPGDTMIVEEVPRNLRLPQPLTIAA